MYQETLVLQFAEYQQHHPIRLRQKQAVHQLHNQVITMLQQPAIYRKIYKALKALKLCCNQVQILLTV